MVDFSEAQKSKIAAIQEYADQLDFWERVRYHVQQGDLAPEKIKEKIDELRELLHKAVTDAAAEVVT